LSTAPRPLDLVPHRRYNPLTREWILVSPQRTQRPWQGETSAPNRASSVDYDPKCYLCPGNARSGGMHNPPYTGVFAFDNDFPALLATEPPSSDPNPSPLLVAEPERGRCRVVCFHPNHSLTLARMTVAEIATVIDAWADETAELGALSYVNHVQIFENRGAMMGASNPHPHCQIWATEHIPDEPLRELASLESYRSDVEGRDDAVRQSVSGELPVHHGIPPAPDAWTGSRSDALSRALLSSTAAQCGDTEVHGRL
jgi:UDPglucose--hexose-1-phosphate uridylyltransferase